MECLFLILVKCEVMGFSNDANMNDKISPFIYKC